MGVGVGGRQLQLPCMRGGTVVVQVAGREAQLRCGGPSLRLMWPVDGGVAVCGSRCYSDVWGFFF